MQPEVGAEKVVRDLFEENWLTVLGAATVAAGGSVHDGWDGTQHAFMQAWIRLSTPSAEPVRRWKPWLVTAAVRHVVRVRQITFETISLNEAVDIPHGPVLDDEVLVRERWRNVLNAVAGLSERRRRALALHDIAGLTTHDVAEEMGVTVSTVRNLLKQARDQVRRQGGGDGGA